MSQETQIINASKLGGIGLRLIGTTDIDGNGTSHEIAEVDPILLFDFAKFKSSAEPPFRPHPHVGLTAMSFLPKNGEYKAWDSLKGDTDETLKEGGLYFVHAGKPAFHHEFPSPESMATDVEVEFIQLVWNATDEDDVSTVIIQPDDIPVITTEDATIRVMAGEFCGVQSVQPFRQRKIIYSYLQLHEGKSLDVEVPSSMNGIVFSIEGDLEINGEKLKQNQMQILGDKDKSLSITNITPDNTSRFIIAAGEPLNKPFCKLIGLGGFIIGKTEQDVRMNMEKLNIEAEALKEEIPHYFPKQYL